MNDDEYKKLMRDLKKDELGPKPYIHKPEQLEEREGAACWLDRSRVCGADCVSYLHSDPEPPLPSDRCRLIVIGEEALITIKQLLNRSAGVPETTDYPIPNPFPKTQVKP